MAERDLVSFSYQVNLFFFLHIHLKLMNGFLAKEGTRLGTVCLKIIINNLINTEKIMSVRPALTTIKFPSHLLLQMRKKKYIRK